ncbi:MAG: methionine synthase, partial [Candidatus Omnitrophota bacterium]
VILRTHLDILSFDAYNYTESLGLYADDVNRFLGRGGILAWGIVPTSPAIEKETAQSLSEKLQRALDFLSLKSIPKEQLCRQMILTPSCGMGTLSVRHSERCLTLLNELSRNSHFV